jgi:hypothetical protein
MWISFKWMFKVNLGDQVSYEGQKYIVANGVRYGSWRLGGLDNGDDGWVRRANCKKVITFSNLKNSYCSGYRFYMTSWYDIWKNGGIKDWMKALDIW